MTREQVHDLMENELRCVQRGNYCDRDCAKCPLVKDDKELIEAYGYVIKALEQEPCEDAISRRVIVEYIKASDADLGHDSENEFAVEDILNMPSVTPTQKWIPVSEKYEHHIDHTDCIWYGNDSGCPVTCSQYRDGWNDAMDYIFKNGDGYRPYRRKENG